MRINTDKCSQLFPEPVDPLPSGQAPPSEAGDGLEGRL